MPAITAWSLRDGSYVEAATVSGDEVLEVTEPFEISLVPSALVTD